MQPRRDTQHTPYGETQNPAEDRLEEEAYQPVKPVGYEARLAFEQERASDARQGRTGPAAPQHTGAPAYGPRGPYAPANRAASRAAPGTSSLYGRPASHAAACAGPGVPPSRL